jgi:hypothetical protein
MKLPNYVEVISENYPNIGVQCFGDPNVYENLVLIEGGALPSQASLDALKLTLAKTQLKKQINEYRQEWMSDYFTYDSKTWNADEEARNNIVGVVLTGVVLGNLLPPGYTYRDYTNVDHVVDFMYMVNMGIALSTFRKTVYVVSQQKKDAVDALTTIAEIEAYNYLTGWPSK